MKILHVLAKGGTGGIESLCVDIAKYSPEENSFYFMWDGGENADKICSLHKKNYVRHFKNVNVFKELNYLKKVCFYNKIEVFIIHGLSPIMLIFLICIKIWCRNIKCIIYIHSDATIYFTGKKGRINKILYQCSYRAADACIAISESVKKSFKVACHKADKISVIYNAVDLSKFTYISEIKQRDKINIIFVGRLIYGKEVNLLIEAVSKLQDKIHLIVVGDGPAREVWENMAICKKIDAEFVGKQTNIPNWLKRADIFVHPATWEEGFGITLIEAMAMGIPCIAFQKGAIPEIIDNNENGIIVSEFNAEALAKAIHFCIDIKNKNPEKWEIMRLKANKKAQIFKIENYVEKFSLFINNQLV